MRSTPCTISRGTPIISCKRALNPSCSSLTAKEHCKDDQMCTLAYSQTTSGSVTPLRVKASRGSGQVLGVGVEKRFWKPRFTYPTCMNM